MELPLCAFRLQIEIELTFTHPRREREKEDSYITTEAAAAVRCSFPRSFFLLRPNRNGWRRRRRRRAKARVTHWRTAKTDIGNIRTFRRRHGSTRKHATQPHRQAAAADGQARPQGRQAGRPLAQCPSSLDLRARRGHVRVSGPRPRAPVPAPGPFLAPGMAVPRQILLIELGGT